jgi:hypothetical protein
MILDEKYKLFPGVSNSMMKTFMADGPTIYFNTFVDPMKAEVVEFSTESTDIGDLADCLTTTPQLFDKYYYITGDVHGSAEFKSILLTARALAVKAALQMGLSAQMALEHPTVKDAVNAGPYLLEAARAFRDPKKEEEEAKKGYRGNYKDDTLTKYMIDNGRSYYNDLTVAAGRKIIDQSLFNIADRVKNQIMNHDTIGSWFQPSDNSDLEILTQHMVTVEINGTMCKILLDYCRIDHKNKIIHPKDVKTAMSRKQFKINYEKFNYNYQGSFYSGVLAHKYPGYKIMPFEFIVACTETNEEPLVYRMSERELTVTRDGASLKSGKTVAGWMNVLDQIKWHDATGQWRFPKEFYETGVVMIDSFNEDGIEATAGAQNEDIF